ncbi:serine hydrolase, partial [Actinacidiphila glaucinigra]
MRFTIASITLASTAVITTLAASPAVAASPSLPAPDISGVLAVQKQAMANGAPGALTRIDSGGSTYRISMGQSDTVARTAMDADRRFRVGSVSKSFTTVVL